MSWLDDFVRQHEELESPLSFWKWSALAAISAVVKDNVYLDRQIHNLYPNIYVMLHADSGLKKGPPISAAKQMVGKVNNTRIISGRSSIQGILKDMGSAETEEGTGKVKVNSTAFICSNELTSSLVGDKVAADILTDLYDRSYNVGQWRSLLKMESFDLKNPTITMLVATNEAHSEDFFGRKDVQGGYFARTFIVYESKRNRTNSLLVPLVNPPNYDRSSEYLRKLSGLKGRFMPMASIEEKEGFRNKRQVNGRTVFFSDSGELYEEWYSGFVKEIDEREDVDKTGTLNRFGDSVLKVAMLLSLSESPDMIITEKQMEAAIELCERLIGNVKRVTLAGQGTTLGAQLKGKVIMELIKRPDHRISQTMLSKKFWMDYTSVQELSDVMVSLESAGLVKIITLGSQVIFVMPETVVSDYQKLLEGKKK